MDKRQFFALVLVAISAIILFFLLRPKRDNWRGWGHGGRGWYYPKWTYEVYDDPYYVLAPNYNTAYSQCKARCVEKHHYDQLSDDGFDKCLNVCKVIL